MVTSDEVQPLGWEFYYWDLMSQKYLKMAPALACPGLATSLNVMARKLAQKFWLYQKLGKSTKDL